jgi:hypothetical protein
MSKVAMKRFANQIVGRVVIIFVGIAIHMNASVMATFTNDYKIKNVVETNMELIGLIISTMAVLNILVGWYLASIEDEEEQLKI